MAKVIGIITEYNPFHRGHVHQIAEARRLSGGDGAVVCVMSGHWVQRGECAVTDKWTRAGAALAGGADLILGLPTLWAMASAETFARGGVSLLAATGVVDALSFGCESGDAQPLLTCARALESPQYPPALRGQLDRGLSFAAARQAAVEALIGDPGKCLATPNNNLAVEYLRALPQGVQVLPVRRVGAAHDGPPAEEVASASTLRGWLRTGALDCARPYLPQPWWGEIHSIAHLERAVLARLRTMTPEEAQALPGGGEGLARRLLRAARDGDTLDEVYALAKTKRYAHARIRRMAMWALLGLAEADRPENPPYLHVLAFGPRGRALLRQMKTCARLPVLTKPAHAKALGGDGLRVFELESRCTDVFGLCTNTPRPGGTEWTTDPVIV